MLSRLINWLFDSPESKASTPWAAIPAPTMRRVQRCLHNNDPALYAEVHDGAVVVIDDRTVAQFERAARG